MQWIGLLLSCHLLSFLMQCWWVVYWYLMCVNGFIQLSIMSITLCTSSSSFFIRRMLESLWCLLSASYSPTISLQVCRVLALSWAFKIHHWTAPQLRLMPTIPPLVLKSLLSVCSIVWSTGTWVNALLGLCWTEKWPSSSKPLALGWVCGSSTISHQWTDRYRA